MVCSLKEFVLVVRICRLGCASRVEKRVEKIDAG